MTFTDDDLKRLKNRNIYRCPCGNILCPEPFDIKALLARLEAAEKVCEEHLIFRKQINYSVMGGTLEAWRKAAGK